MKSAATLADLRRDALAQGATVAVKGERFNAGGSVAVVKKPPPAPPTPAPEPPPVAAPPPQAAPAADMEPVAKAITAQSAANYEGLKRLGESITAALAKPAVSAPDEPYEPCVYIFTVDRDERGLIRSVTAVPQPKETPA